MIFVTHKGTPKVSRGLVVWWTYKQTNKQSALLRIAQVGAECGQQEMHMGHGVRATHDDNTYTDSVYTTRYTTIPILFCVHTLSVLLKL